MITTKDKIGYISRRFDRKTGKESFKFIESKIKKVVYGKIKNSIYTDRFYSLDLEDVESNTKMITNNQIMLVGEPFVTNPKYSEHCRKVVEYWNVHGARDIFDKQNNN